MQKRQSTAKFGRGEREDCGVSKGDCAFFHEKAGCIPLNFEGKNSPEKFTKAPKSDTLHLYWNPSCAPSAGDGAGLSRYNRMTIQIITVLAIGQMGTGL